MKVLMGTPRGILAVEEVPGAIRLAAARLDWPGGSTLRMYRETENPELLALLPSPFQGGARMTDEAPSRPAPLTMSTPGPRCAP